MYMVDLWGGGGLQAAICRCSQPLSGFSARCLEDEQMLEAIRQANPNSPFMYVVDTRPKVCTVCRHSQPYRTDTLWCNEETLCNQWDATQSRAILLEGESVGDISR